MRKLLLCVSVCLFFFAKSQTTVNFSYTGSVQQFTVPISVYSISFDIYGAAGDSLGVSPGGKGGRVQGVMLVNPGDVIYINVGAEGISSLNSPGVFNGGGGVYSYSTCGYAGTGGGGTDLRLNSNTLGSLFAVAGGGGGAGGATGQTYAGGDGGGLIGADGIPWVNWPNSGGKGGTQSAGGAQGVACCSCPTYTTDGSVGQGGNGSGDCAGGGGGGGGYYGGGGSCFGGGGGGSSYTVPSVTGVVHTQGFQNGNGFASITYSQLTYVDNLGNSGDILLYPNPFSSELTLDVKNIKNGLLTMVSINGQKIFSGNVKQGINVYNTCEVAPGIYLLEIVGENYRRVIKVVKD